MENQYDREGKRLYSLRESADQLNLSYSTIKSWVHLGRIPVVRLGRRTMVQASILNKLVDEGLESVQNESIIRSNS